MIFRSVLKEFTTFKRFEKIAGLKPPFLTRQLYFFLASVAIAVGLVYVLKGDTLPRQSVFMAGIFVLSALLWMTEALPLFATSILIVGLEILLLANPGNWPGLGFEGINSPDYTAFLAPIANPVIVLFFGGFLLAQAVVKEGVDKTLAGIILRLFGEKPMMVLLGVMLVTAVFSMWMSNTATTAMMVTLVVPMMAQVPEGDPIRKGLLLAVPFSANIGGIGTPIASPPNAVAYSMLANEGYPISFLHWVLIAVPLMLFLLLLTWLLLYSTYKPLHDDIVFKPQKNKIETRGWYVITVLVFTVLLWLTESIHGLSSAIVALVPAIAFTATGLLTRQDVNSLDWHILILIIGGIALGDGMRITGLDSVLVNMIPKEGAYIMVGIIVTTLVFSTFISNTAAANLILPIGISYAMENMASTNNAPIQVGMSIALAASLAMALPISTPPNTIAYVKGELVSKDFIRNGVIIGVLSLMLIYAFGGYIINFWLSL